MLLIEHADEFVESQTCFGNGTTEGSSCYLAVVRDGESCDMPRLGENDMAAPLSDHSPPKLLEYFEDFGGSEEGDWGI